MNPWLWWNNSTRPHHRGAAQLKLEALEPRAVPASAGAFALVNYQPFSTANGLAPDTAVDLVGPTGNALLPEFAPFPGDAGPIAASTGDVNGTGVPDVVVAADAPDIPVKVFDGATGNLLLSFYAFPGFNGTVSVGAADVNGDGRADVLVAANGANGHVKAFSGADGTLLSSFFAFPGFLGQVSVAGADFNQSGHAQIVVGAGAPGVNGRVVIFNPDGTVSNTGFFAFPNNNGQINLATGDVNGDGVPDIIVGAGPGAPGGHIKVYSGTDLSLIDSFLSFAPTLGAGDTEGVLVGAGDANGDGRADILAVPEGSPLLGPVAFDGVTGANVNIPANYFSSNSSSSYSC
jgi:hypothetical protein